MPLILKSSYNGICVVEHLSNRTIFQIICLTGQFIFFGKLCNRTIENFVKINRTLFFILKICLIGQFDFQNFPILDRFHCKWEPSVCCGVGTSGLSIIWILFVLKSRSRTTASLEFLFKVHPWSNPP